MIMIITNYGNIFNYQTGKFKRIATYENYIKSLGGDKFTGAYKDFDGETVYCDG